MILDLFSKRTRKKQNDLFKYDQIPEEFRVQVIHIWKDAIGMYRPPGYRTTNVSPSNSVWTFIQDQLAREYGKFRLGESNDPFVNCQQFILSSNVEHVLDIIELSFRYIDVIIRNRWNDFFRLEAGVTMKPDAAIEELNERLTQHGLGFQFTNSQIVRVDSQFVYTDVVKPSLTLLNEEEFQGASQEFMSAHEHLRYGRYKEAVNDALKAFESVLKTICTRMNWAYKETDTARKLVDICFDKGLVPSSLQAHFTALRTTLESGLPTVRNKTSGHGQGESTQEVPLYLAVYALHLAATNIVFLVEAYKQIKKK